MTAVEIISMVASFVAILVSVVAIIIPIRIYGKNVVLAENYKLIYEEFPKKIDLLLRKKNVEVLDVEDVKDFICNHIKPAFSFIKFRNYKKHDAIKKILNDLENCICQLIEHDDNFECRKQVNSNMMKFYKTLDKYLHFVK